MPNFFGGLAQGLQAGDLNGAIDDFVKARQAKKASEALANWAQSQGQGGQPPPQAGPQPQGGPPNPAAALAALGGGGGQPAPSAPPPSAPAPSAGPGPMAGPQPLASPPAAPQAPPKPAPDPSLSATAQPGQQFGDPMQEAQQTLGALIRSVKAANPKIDPRTLMNAVDTQLGEMKGILPTTKAVMQGQVQLLKSQMDIKFKYDKLEAENERFAEKMVDLSKRHASLEELDAAREEHMRRMDAVSQERADSYGQSVEDQHTDRQAAESGRNSRNSDNNQTKRDTTAQTNETRKDISGDRSDDSTYRSDQSFRGNQVRSGVTPDAAPQRRGRPGGIPGNVQQFAKQHNLTIIRKRADGKYDAKAKDGTVGVIG